MFPNLVFVNLSHDRGSVIVNAFISLSPPLLFFLLQHKVAVKALLCFKVSSNSVKITELEKQGGDTSHPTSHHR